MTRQMVTVCIPTYNRADYLPRALRGILKQTYRPIEVFVLDNHSTDRTPHILKAMRTRGLRVVRHKKNLGSLGNFNKAITTGTGAYLAIYHDDDEYLKSIVAEQVRILTKHPDVTCVYTRSTIIGERGEVLGIDSVPDALVDRPLSYEELLAYLLTTGRSPYITPSFMARRSAFRTAGEYHKKYDMAGDVDMHLRLTRIGKAYIIGARLVRYRHRADQASIVYSTTYTEQNQFFSLLDEQLASFRPTIAPRVLEKYEARRDFDFTVRAVNALANPVCTQGSRRKAREHLARSLTWRRIALFDPYVLITCALSIAAHVGCGGWLARAINKYRLRKHMGRLA